MAHDNKAFEVNEDEPWQSQFTRPDQRLAALLQSSRLTDLTIIFPGQKKVIRAHRLILAMSSPVFEAMLLGPSALPEGHVLNLQEDSPEAFKCLMQYMYLGRPGIKEVDIAVQVLRLSNTYQLNGLKSYTSQFLQMHLNLYNLPEIYNAALMVSDSTLTNKCTQIVMKSPTHLLTSNVKFLTRRVLSHLMSQSLSVSEVEKFAAVLAWGRSQLESRQMEESPENLRRTICQFLPQMEIMTMTPEEFVDCIAPTGIFTREENMAILLNIKKVSGVPLPMVCSMTPERSVFREERQLKCIQFECNRYSNRGSIRVNGLQDQVLLANLRVSKAVELQRISCNHIDFYEATAIVRGSGGLVQQKVISKGSEGVFPRSVVLRTCDTCTITVKTKGFSCPLLHSFSLWHGGVRFEGQRPFLKSKGPTLFFWSLTETRETSF